MRAVEVVKSLGVPLDTVLTWSYPAGVVSDAGVARADDVLYDWARAHNNTGFKRLDSTPPYGVNFPLFSDLLRYCGDEWRSWLITSGELTGTIVKRYNKWVKAHLGINVPDDLLGALGSSLGGDVSRAEDSIFVDFTNDFNWCAGDFGESSGSCWWGDYNGARLGLSQNGGLACRIWGGLNSWGGRDGVGRCWVYADHCYKDDLRLFIFNAYHNGGHNLGWFARLLSHNLGLLYVRGSLSADHAYINGSSSYCLASADSLPSSGYVEEFDFAIDAPTTRCEGCGCFLNLDDDDVYHFEGYDYCESCYDDRVGCCDECGDSFWSDDMNYIDSEGVYICDGCLRRFFSECARCGEYFRDSSMVNVEGFGDVCESCAGEFPVCDSCGCSVVEDSFNADLGLCLDCVPVYDDSDDDSDDVGGDASGSRLGGVNE